MNRDPDREPFPWLPLALLLAGLLGIALVVALAG